MNYKVQKFFAIFILTILLIVSSSSYYSIKGIDNLAYVVAIGLDVGKDNNLKLSLQLSVPNSGEGRASSSSQSSSAVVNSIECPSINSGISIFNSYLGKEVTLSHCKVLVISEELASKGVSEYLYTLTNDIQFRTDSNIIVSKCDAESFLKYSTPLLDKVSARYYEIAPTSSEYTGYTESVTCNEFFNSINDTISQPVAILGNINTSKTQNKTSDRDSSYTAGETPISGETGIETMGLAVFNGDKLVGELTGLESICHLIISSKLKSAQLRIPSPIEQLEFIDLYIELDNNTKNSVYLVNGSPYITSNVNLIARIQSMNSNIDLDSPEIISQIQNYAERYISNQIYDYLYKTSKELNSDIDDFGLYSLKYFTNISDLNEYNWNHHYKDAFFNVNVNVNLRSSYLLVNTSKEDE